MDEVILLRAEQFLGGSNCLSLLVISLFFVKFWRQTRDRLFVFFAGAFFLLTSERIIRLGLANDSEFGPYVYSLRLAAFLLIIVAIIDKNRQTK